ncbi:MAG: site-specific DNA-methyltransferase [Treponema sp.]|nr:site-specific DNA-methyltransferase [Treponema sp.]
MFPSLESIEKVENAPKTSLWHTIIEADNFHALQLLAYLYPKQVDCIYIDPPYNTGARDWKYNNDYVDATDAWRHSKWLSMMQKRLKLAQKILNPETGILIVAIDDYEVAHLLILLEELFPDYSTNTVIVNHHPQGGGGDNVSRTHEYALFLTPSGKNILRGYKRQGFEESWSLARSGKDSRNFRYGRPNQFYAIYVDSETFRVMGVGKKLTRDEAYSKTVAPKGCRAIFPISKKDNTERVWRYERSTMEELIARGDIICTQNFSLKVVKHREIKYDVIFSLWTDIKYNAGTNGTDILSEILGANGFAYPKSLYTVSDALRFSTQDNPNAIIVDFFAGSGTTLHAVNLLNAEDGGNRQCILVTNNEVSEPEAKTLLQQGHKPGDAEWEKQGICRSVTWPRTAYSILGKHADGTFLEGDYYTNQTAEHEELRSFFQLGFVEDAPLSLSSKRQIVSFLRSKEGKSLLPQNLIKPESSYIVSDKHTASILFDCSVSDQWIEALEEQDHITEFYIVTKDNAVFTSLKEKANDLLGPIIVSENIKRPMKDGFAANVEYFKLGFLDRENVSLGRQFREILPLLWLKAGALGERPKFPKGKIPDMLILPQNNFAILNNEDMSTQFLTSLKSEKNISIVYIVTNSESTYRQISGKIKARKTYQLYKDYIDNFVLGVRSGDQ